MQSHAFHRTGAETSTEERPAQPTPEAAVPVVEQPAPSVPVDASAQQVSLDMLPLPCNCRRFLARLYSFRSPGPDAAQPTPSPQAPQPTQQAQPPQPTQQEETVHVPSDSEGAAGSPRVAGGDASTSHTEPRPTPGGGAMWTAPESSAAAGRRSVFGSARPWADLAMEDVGGSSNEPMEVDISDIAFARQGLDLLEETRRNMAVVLRAEQRQFVQSRDFLTQQRQDIATAREELSHARAELERRRLELEQREHGLQQREVAIDASRTAEQLQQQLSELRAVLDSERARFEREQREQMDGWRQRMSTYEEQHKSLTDQLQVLQATRENLQKQLHDAAVREEAQLRVSRNTAAEFDRVTNIYKVAKEEALERQQKAEEELAAQGASLERARKARNDALLRADTLSTELAKRGDELGRQVAALARIQRWIADTMPKLDLKPAQLEDCSSLSGLLKFFANFAGQLEALPDLLAERATREGKQIVEALAELILPRVHHLAPGFPFDALLEEFATEDEEAAALAAVGPAVEAVKEAAKRE